MSILTLPTVGSISPTGSSIHHLGRDAGTTRSLISLAAAGFVTVEGNRVVLTPKGQKAKKKEAKAKRRAVSKEIVFRAVQNVAKNKEGLSLTKPIHFVTFVMQVWSNLFGLATTTSVSAGRFTRATHNE